MISFPSIKLAFLGCGSIAQSFIKGYLAHSKIQAKNLFISGRNLKKIKRISKELKVQKVLDNEELLEKADVVFICVKPDDLEEAVQHLRTCWCSEQTVVSVLAGTPFKSLKKVGLNGRRLVRLMPNTSVCVGEGFLPFCSLDHQSSLNSFMEELLEPLGQTLILEREALLDLATVASASGLAFVYELMEYWLEWLIEGGFPEKSARTLVIQTFLGASFMSRKRAKKSFLDLQKEVSSPKGVTFYGLQAMREQELERILRLSFEKVCSQVKILEK